MTWNLTLVGNITQNTPDCLIQGIIKQVYVFIPLTILALFIVLATTSYYSIRRLTGRDDVIASMMVSAILVSIVSTLMSFGNCPWVNGDVMIGVIGFTIIIAIIFFATSNRE